MSLNISLVDAHVQPVPLQIHNPQDSSTLAPNFHNVPPIIPQSQDSYFDSAHNLQPFPSSESKESSDLDDSLNMSQSQRITLKSPRLSSAVGCTKNGSFPATLKVCSMKSCHSKPSKAEELNVEPLVACHGNGGKKPLLLTYGEIYLRRSPRFTSSSIACHGNGGKKPLLLTYGEMNLRRSPRFTSSSMGNNTLKMPFRGSDRSNITKSLRSRRGFNNKVDSDCSILSDALAEQPYKRIKTVLDNSETKMLTHSQEKKEDYHYTSEKMDLLSYENKDEIFCSLIGDPLPSDEAQERWRWRYEMKNQKSNRRKLLLDDDDEDKIVWNVESHYAEAQIKGYIYKLGDCAYIKGDGGKKHIGRIIEFFKTTDKEEYFRVQWFYRVEDTVIQEEGAFHDKKRLFYSTVMNDNPIDCIISKVSVVQVLPKISSKRHAISPSGFYFDMEYSVEYSSFRTMHIDDSFKKNKSSSYPIFVEPVPYVDISSLEERIQSALVPMTTDNTPFENILSCRRNHKAELSLLDIFSGCGGMSTGLCLGAKVSSVNLVTRWALDKDKSACESFKLNHPETHVRNEGAEDFLELLKQWEKLCKKYVVYDTESIHQSTSISLRDSKQSKDPKDDGTPGEYEVSKVVDVCYGDPDETGSHGLKFKVHWKGYSSSEDTWEPIENLSNCKECIRDFVRCGFKSKILPLPGDVDVICGGPPCQGISGYNRYRNVDSPLSDERNRQIVVFMDIVQFLKPKFVLMENVVDIIRFDKASLARYALSRLVHMKYQARLGTMAAGCYGLPQFRLRVFVWGAHPSEKLPQFPLPTHEVIVRYWPPSEFERNTVAYDENQPRELEKASVLRDILSDLPPVTNRENREVSTYEKPPETDFQRFIRSTIHEMTGTSQGRITKVKSMLYDHRPCSLAEDDYARLCMIPKKKGANFRDLPGVVVGSDNVVRRDPTMEQPLLPSGRPLVPDCAFTYEQGKSKRPYGRLWWDETVSTVLTIPSLRNQVLAHPEQDRVLTIRESARLQGFPDYYRFSGSVKERYRQIGNAVAVPVGRALGYALGMAFQKLSGDEPLMKLPPNFSYSTNLELAKSLSRKYKPSAKLTPIFSSSSNLELAEYKLTEEKNGR